MSHQDHHQEQEPVVLDVLRFPYSGEEPSVVNVQPASSFRSQNAKGECRRVSGLNEVQEIASSAATRLTKLCAQDG